MKNEIRIWIRYPLFSDIFGIFGWTPRELKHLTKEKETRIFLRKNMINKKMKRNETKQVDILKVTNIKWIKYLNYDNSSFLLIYIQKKTYLSKWQLTISAKYERWVFHRRDGFYTTMFCLIILVSWYKIFYLSWSLVRWQIISWFSGITV